MDWNHIADDWAAMTRRLSNSGLHVPHVTDGAHGENGNVPEDGGDAATVAAAQAIVMVARRMAGK
jgi:hypothetical protein